MDKETLKFAKTLNPLFVRAWECHGCDNCNSFWSIFGQLESDKEEPENGYISGGFHCPHCDFSNAGRVLVSMLEDYHEEEENLEDGFFHPDSYAECGFCHVCGEGGKALNSDCMCALCWRDER